MREDYPPDELARRYGVVVHHVKHLSEVPAEVLGRRDWFRGPGGHGAVCGNEVWFVWGEGPRDPELLSPYHFHEVVHAIVDVPTHWLDSVYESFVLLNFERALARILVKPRCVVSYSNIVAYQEETVVNELGDTLVDVGYSSDLWKRGYRYCEEIGILDAKHRPTWKRPTWPEYDIYGRWLEEVGFKETNGARRNE